MEQRYDLARKVTSQGVGQSATTTFGGLVGSPRDDRNPFMGVKGVGGPRSENSIDMSFTTLRGEQHSNLDAQRIGLFKSPAVTLPVSPKQPGESVKLRLLLF